MGSNPVHRFTEDEYLALELAAEYKSEYVNGEIFARPYATLNHLRLQSNFWGELGICLRNGPCDVFGSDFRIKIPPAKAYLYPDLSVVRGHLEVPDHPVNPLVIVEIFSPSTEGYDRGWKFTAYRTLESLKNY